MALFLSEENIRSLVSMKDAIEAVTQVFEFMGKGEVLNPPRQQISLAQGYLRITSAFVNPLQKIAVKVSSSMIFKNSSGRILVLIDSKSGKIEALMEVFYLGALRTGAASGVATRLLSRSDSSTVGIFGSGRQAKTQLLAVTAVRPIEKIIVTSPNQVHLTTFCNEMTNELGIPVLPAKRPDDLYICDILISATTSKQPVIFGKYLRPGTHINAMGANRQERRELDDGVIKQCTTIAVDNKEQAKKESAALACGVKNKIISWKDVKEMGELLTGKYKGRPGPQSITLYNSHGVAMEDVGLATKVYQEAIKKGVGVEIPFTEN